MYGGKDAKRFTEAEIRAVCNIKGRIFIWLN
jgi:hypothetical protein